MISEEHKCIFIHIPKTGGDSIEKSIWKDFTASELFGQPNPYQTGGMQHLKAFQIRSKVGELKFKDFFKFSFVRNPYSRILSQYFYTMNRRPDLQKVLDLSYSTSFKEYVVRLSQVDFDGIKYLGLPRVLRKFPKLIYLEANHISKLHIQWEKQYKFIFDHNGEQLVDFLGKFENLQEDYNRICREIGIPENKLPHNTHGVKKPKNKHYSEYYDEETRKIVENIYKEDIDLFGYDFEKK